MSLISLDRLKLATRTLGFRLGAWHMGIFLAGSILVLTLAYLGFSSSLQSEDRGEILAELSEQSAIYKASGLAGMRSDAAQSGGTSVADGFFIGIRYGNGESAVISPIRPGLTYDINALGRPAIPGKIRWDMLPAGDEEEDRLEVASELLPDGAILQVGRDTSSREEVLEDFRNKAALILIPAALLAILGGALLTRRVLAPLHRLADTVRNIEGGEMRARVSVTGTGDELDDLGRLFNRMLNKISSLVDGMRNALDNVAHDLRTPMTRLRAVAETALLPEKTPADRAEALSDCLEESDKVLALLKALMDISEAETGTMRLTREHSDLRRLMKETAEVYRYPAEAKNIRILLNDGPGQEINCDRARVRQAIANLLDNAVKYTPSGGEVRLDLREEGKEVLLTVADNGPGVPVEDLAHIWERLYRGDQSRSEKGLGLGLSLVRAVMKAHGGSAQVTSSPAGAAFTLRFPGSSHSTAG